MKKWLIVLLALCLLILAGCGQNKETNQRESLLKAGAYMPDKPDPNNSTYDWGVSMAVENLTPTGCTLKVTQSGGEITGEVSCGCDFWVEQFEDGAWTALKTPENLCWTAEGYMLNNRTSTFVLKWEYIYGTLPAGTYRIGKAILDWRHPGDYDCQDYYTEPFAIE